MSGGAIQWKHSRWEKVTNIFRIFLLGIHVHFELLEFVCSSVTLHELNQAGRI